MFAVLYLSFLVSFLASVVGSICGIGGGVIIKPVLDICGFASVSTISFLSGCTVLSMSGYTVCRNFLSGENHVKLRIGLPLAVGAAVGGTAGKYLFSYIQSLFVNQNSVGAVQAAVLAVITLGTALYTVYRSRIKPLDVESAPLCVLIGLFLGVMSSFLGIGGGPINLVVLFHFFRMDTKTAAQNSLYIILFSQIASLIATLVTRSVPPFEVSALLLMVVGGIGGGMLGRSINRHMDNRAVDKLFLAMMMMIVAVSIANIWRYSAL